MNTPARTLSLVDKTVEQIIKYITDNNLQPEEKLPTESEFIQKLHVGRGTLREAIKHSILEIYSNLGKDPARMYRQNAAFPKTLWD